jgi:hypothetical protein
MTEAPSTRPGIGQWLLLLVLAGWLAFAPLVVTAVLMAVTDSPPLFAVQMGLAAPGEPGLPRWVLGLLTTGLTLALNLLLFAPLWFATRRRAGSFAHTIVVLSITIAVVQALGALASLACRPPTEGLSIPASAGCIAAAVLRLVLILPFLLLVLGKIEARTRGGSRRDAWRRAGLRRWVNASAMWLALAAGAVIVWPWVVAGSLGSSGTVVANLVQALPNALNEEILFRGFALSWLWWAARGRGAGAVASLILFVAAQGGTMLPHGDYWALGRFVSALTLGLLVVELTIRSGGSIWPAVIVHLLYDWFRLAFVDPRTLEEPTLLLARIWAPLAAGGLAVLLLLGRKIAGTRAASRSTLPPPPGDGKGGAASPSTLPTVAGDVEGETPPPSTLPTAAGDVEGETPLPSTLPAVAGDVEGETPPPSTLPTGAAGTVKKPAWGTWTAAGLAIVAWLGIALLYWNVGTPGFHPDGFLIFLEEQADLSPAAAIGDPVERRTWVYEALVETAERSQAPLRAELERRGVAYRPHYLVNMIEVEGRPGLGRSFSGEPGVASVLFQPGVRRYAYPFVIPGMDLDGPQGVEWNVREVGAEKVWELGYTGQGVIVGDADTGVAWDHPALKESYLGWEGGTASHDYHWYDPWDGRAEPWDDNGHGTHTTGTVLGSDGENRIGIAPGARWIACRNMRQGLGNPGRYVSCMEFLLAPFPLDSDPFHDGDPARGAHIVNNSWGCPPKEGCEPDTLRIATDNLRAAGQMMVTSAGNDGPACGTVEAPPALYDSTLTVGATYPDDQAASFSSRGPVVVDDSGRPKPDLVAPGVNIRSAVPDGYTLLPGTSMAGPHVAGAVALLWSAEPALIGDLDGTEAILTETAQRLTVSAVCGEGEVEPGSACGCGEDVAGGAPNNVYGWGQVDVWAAVQKVLGGR